MSSHSRVTHFHPMPNNSKFTDPGHLHGRAGLCPLGTSSSTAKDLLSLSKLSPKRPESIYQVTVHWGKENIYIFQGFIGTGSEMVLIQDSKIHCGPPVSGRQGLWLSSQKKASPGPYPRSNSEWAKEIWGPTQKVSSQYLKTFPAPSNFLYHTSPKSSGSNLILVLKQHVLHLLSRCLVHSSPKSSNSWFWFIF